MSPDLALNINVLQHLADLSKKSHLDLKIIFSIQGLKIDENFFQEMFSCSHKIFSDASSILARDTSYFTATEIGKHFNFQTEIVLKISSPEEDRRGQLAVLDVLNLLEICDVHFMSHNLTKD